MPNRYRTPLYRTVRAPASNGAARRLVKVALLQCIADGVNGKGTYPTHGKFVEMFVTQEVRDPPDAGIYGEIVRARRRSTNRRSTPTSSWSNRLVK